MIIIGFELTDTPITPIAMLVDKQNPVVCDMTETAMTTAEEMLAKANT